ncbi:MAG: amidohydrolase family protein [Actinobacteria bacterium]|nr:amidohydrolase family protein [Actinomycetota bacterium]MBO0786659.1 amidohydrolase family protein [Actinomycetota bacterium]
MADANSDKPRFSRRAFVNGAAASAALAAGSVAGMGPAHAAAKSGSASGASDAPDDLLLTNGNVLTLDGRSTVASSVSIRDGRITAVGRGGGGAQQVVNLRGATVIPGLNDSHIHFIRLGTNPGYGVRDIEVAQSIGEMQQIISERAKTVPEGQFITCFGGWNRLGLKESRLPTPAELDSAAPHNPVVLSESQGGGAGITNTQGAAFFSAHGVTVNGDGTVNPASAMNALTAVQTDADRLRGTADAVDHATKLGLTTVQDMGGLVGLTSYKYALKLWAKDQLNLRIRFFNWSGDDPGVSELETRVANQLNQLGDQRYRPVGAGERVHNSTTDPINVQAYQFASQNGWTLTQHSLTPQEVAFHIGAYQEAAKAGPIDQMRWSLCHVDPITEDEIAQVKAMGIGLNIQGYGFIRAAGAQSGPPFRSLVESGIPLGAGTDATVVGPMDPWLMMYFMTTGNNNAGQLSGITGQTISRLDALRMYTSGSAYLSFDDDELGTIESGKLADLAVLSDNPLQVSDQNLRRITSNLTLVGGRVVHQAGPFAGLRFRG